MDGQVSKRILIFCLLCFTIPKMSLHKEKHLKRELQGYTNEFQKVLEREISGWEYNYVESACVTFITGRDWQAMSEGSDRQDMIAWLNFSINGNEEFFQIEIYINDDMFEPRAVPKKFKKNIFRIVLEHELREFYYLQLQYGKREDDTEDRGNGPAHRYALECEWRLAFQNGHDQQYLRCIRNWASKIEQAQGKEVADAFRSENTAMYTKLLAELRSLDVDAKFFA